MLTNLWVKGDMALGSVLASTNEEIKDKLDDVGPDFSLFGGEFDSLWQQLLGGLLALLMIASLGFLAVGFFKMQRSKDDNPQAFAAAKEQVLWSGLALAIFASFGVIVGLFLNLAA